MDTMELKTAAREFGFAEAYILPPPDYAPNENEPSIVWNTDEYPWATAVCLLLWPYRPYPADCRIPAYYIESNRSYHASVALARRLEAEGVRIKRAEVPIKQLAVRYGVAVPLKSSLISVPGYGTRTVFQSLLIGADENNSIAPETYSVSEPELCSSCRACEKACPAGAIDGEGYHLERCMRYYMDGADYPDWVYAIQRTHLGCEVCQQVCPHNARIPCAPPPEEVTEAFGLDRLAAGFTKEARLLVGKNITGHGKLQKEAVNFCRRGVKETDQKEKTRMEFTPSRELKFDLPPEQAEMLSSKETIKKVVEDNPDTVMAFDIYEGADLIGFVLVHRFEEKKYFLWDYAIAPRFQNMGKGTRALREFMGYMKTVHGAEEMTTTYIFGNDTAKRMYEKVGFVETDVVDEPDCHEVNMAVRL